MSQSECGNCARPIADGAAICAMCATGLARDLRDVPDLLDDLLVTLARQDKMGAGGKAGAPDEQPAPRLDVSRVMDGLCNTITTWARDLAESHALEVPMPARPAQDARMHAAAVAADWLADQMHLLRAHPAAMEALDALTAAIHTARDKIDRPEDRTRVPVGPCPETDHHGAPCAGQIWAHIPTDQRWLAELRCNLCGQRWDTARWHRTAARITARRGELAEDQWTS